MGYVVNAEPGLAAFYLAALLKTLLVLGEVKFH